MSALRLPTWMRGGRVAEPFRARPQLEILEPRRLLSAADPSPLVLNPSLLAETTTSQTENLNLNTATSLHRVSSASDLNPARLGRLKPLPISDEVTLDGAIDPQVGELLYQITVEPGTSALQIEIRSPDPSNPLNGSIDVLDESGKSIGGVVTPSGSNSVSINVMIGDLPVSAQTGHTFFLKVSSAPIPSTPIGSLSDISPPIPSANRGNATSTTSTSSATFILSVTHKSSPLANPLQSRINVASSTKSDPSQPVSGAGSVAVAGTASTQIQSSSTVSNISHLLNPSLASTIPATGLVATGPLPSRAGFPGRTTGDVSALNEGENRAPVVDLALMDLPRSPLREGQDFEERERDGLEWEGSPEGPVITLRGPGGLPLFGSSIENSEQTTRPVISFAQTPKALSAVPKAPIPASSTESDPAKRTGTVAKADRPKLTDQAPRLSGLMILGVTLTSSLWLPSVPDPIRKRSGWRSILRRFRFKIIGSVEARTSEESPTPLAVAS